MRTDAAMSSPFLMTAVQLNQRHLRDSGPPLTGDEDAHVSVQSNVGPSHSLKKQSRIRRADETAEDCG